MDVVVLDASQQQADDHASFALVENVAQAQDFNFLAVVDDALLDLARRNRATALASC
jgi:hypothetical protein